MWLALGTIMVCIQSICSVDAEFDKVLIVFPF